MTFSIYHPRDLFAHRAKPGHPERPHRLQAAMASVDDLAGFVTFQPALRSRLDAANTLHDPRYLAALSRPFEPGEPPRVLDGGDTTQSSESLDAALDALGSSFHAVDAMLAGPSLGAFIACRPPGHHACASHAMGFCLMGTAALAAKHAQIAHGARVAVLDFDLHHGNGTEDLLWNEKDIMFASTHQEGIWPQTGAATSTGAHGQIINRPLPKGSGRDAMQKAWKEIFARVRSFQPDLIVVSAGFDAHADDPLSGLRWSIEDYDWIGENIAELADDLCEGRVLSILEGGYDLTTLRYSVSNYLAPFIALHEIPPMEEQQPPKLLSPTAGANLSPYLVGNIPMMAKAEDGRFACVKANSRLWIQDQETGAMVYTTPDFLSLNSRDPMKALAAAFNEAGHASIDAIITFEHLLPRAFGYTKRSSEDFEA